AARLPLYRKDGIDLAASRRRCRERCLLPEFPDARRIGRASVSTAVHDLRTNLTARFAASLGAAIACAAGLVTRIEAPVSGAKGNVKVGTTGGAEIRRTLEPKKKILAIRTSVRHTERFERKPSKPRIFSRCEGSVHLR